MKNAIPIERKIYLLKHVTETLNSVNNGSGVEWEHYQGVGLNERHVAEDLCIGNFEDAEYSDEEIKFINEMVLVYIREQDWEKKANA